MSGRSPSFDLVVATVGRTEPLGRFFDSLEAQAYGPVRVLLVDQNADARIESVVGERPFEVVRLHSELGLSRARNVALPNVTADLVAFPDDDCVYPPGLLARVARRLADDLGLGGLTGRAEDESGRSSSSWSTEPAILTTDNLWNRGISFTIFLRTDVVHRIGCFDERLGLGSSEPWSSGEEIDYLIRAVRAGTRIAYDPSLVVLHEVRHDDAAIGYRDGASIGYLLRKHRYPARVLTRMLVRPLGGAVTSLVRGDRARASYYAATLRGRIAGYFGARRSKISA